MEKRCRFSLAALPEDDHTSRRACHAGPASLRATVYAVANDQTEAADHFVERDGLRFAGTHLIIDLWNASHLDNVDIVEGALRAAVIAAGATLLKLDLHRFSPSGGITSVAVLAESHVTIHTWPERSYAAVDVFMCGNANPHKTINVLRSTFRPKMLTVSEHRRGVVP